MAFHQRKLQKIGNSIGVLIPADLLQKAGFARDAQVILLAERGKLTITALDPDFDEMVAAAERFTQRHANALTKLAQ